MIQIGTPQEVQAYYESEDLGQSSLKKLLKGIAEFGKTEDSNQAHFVIGSAVDCLLTGQEGEFEEKYYVSQIEKRPTDAMLDILNLVHASVLEDYAQYLEVVQPVTFKEDHFELIQDTLDGPVPQSTLAEFAGKLENWEAYILEAHQNTGYQPRWTAETRIKNTLPFEDYFLDLCKAFGKQVIDATQNNTIKAIVESLKTNPRTSRFFDREAVADLSNIEFYYQFPVYFEYRGQNCKALLDLVIVERDLDGQILAIQPVDLKTMHGNTFNFIYSLKERRYDIQAAWYTLALQQYFAFDNINPFIFVVESTTYQGKPLAFQVTEEILSIGKNGRAPLTLVETDFFRDGSVDVACSSSILLRKILGYEDLLDMYIYHNENGWSAEKEILEQPVEKPLLLNWEGIVS